MKHPFLFLLLCLVMTSCRTATKVVTVDHPSHDTLIMNTVRYDSIYFDHWHYIDRNADTVRVVEHHTEHRYQLLHDTIYISRVDTIPVVQEVKTTTPPKPNLLDVFSLFLVIGILFTFMFLILCLMRGNKY